MSTTRKELKYRCSDDCLQSGCQGHTARMSYESVCDILDFVDGKNIEVSFKRGSLEAFMKLLRELSKSRIEIKHLFNITPTEGD